ncbi:oxidoreductase [Candidatus Magnetobacterium bavaricum]|uniref:Oxidoreductase n=1 Tax=Candidatus Magnetobacterium bavaricum TaxID=29290 RepID=A0A0F3GJJ8_9BACT|nr:oxidoreductase [Candidatus Magnetobacterium bavaricum]
MTPFNAGIIGLGAIGSLQDEDKKVEGIYSHAGAIDAIKEYNLIAVCEPRRDRLEVSKKMWGVKKGYTNIAEFLENEPLHTVSICTPDETHFAVLKQVLTCAKHIKVIITEKPLVLSYDECREIRDLATEKKVLIEVNNQRRVDGSHIEASKLIKEGELGMIQGVSAYYVKGLFHIASTMVDTLMMLLGDIKWVQAIPPFFKGKYGNSDFSTDFILGFKDDVTAVVQSCDKGGYWYSIFEIDVLGAKGRLCISENGTCIEHFKVVEYPNYPGFSVLGEPVRIPGDMNFAILHLFKTVLQELRDGVFGLGKFALEAMKGIRILEMVRESEKMSISKVHV